MDRLVRFNKEVVDAVDARLGKILPHSGRRPETLHEAMRYAVLGGGKRLRPILAVASFLAAGGEDRTRVVDAGCALELLHAYSLVHDDLPAMDNDSMRRNRLTCHKAFGEATAILVGDALQALAFETLACAAGPNAAEAVTELAVASGSVGMVGGQMLDMEGEGREQDIEEIERIDKWKTGALITASCRLGGIFASAGPEVMERLTAYGKAIGVMYQICDDILDVIAKPEMMGKATGKDQKAGKLTYPGALGIEAARTRAEEKNSAAQNAIREFGKEALYLRLLTDYLLDRTT